ncbi:MAG: aromatic ring-hydroxylating dioxygenase subunit alpha [Actinobacteria bacterium]|nr:aromatic ring-hydroxylating dioxygenase subunit alpha [Actinomycetota bacterium]
MTQSDLSAGRYVDESLFEAERASLWSTSWVSVCRVDDVAEAGSFYTVNVAREPVVVVRGRDNELRAFGNVCPHRNSTIAEGSGTTRALQCPYHNWTFRLDGSLAAAPNMDGVEGFDADQLCLPKVLVEVWNGWVFVNLDLSAASLSGQIGGLSAQVEPYELGSLKRVGAIRHDQSWNWKVTVENFAESYHHAAVHPDTLHKTYPGQKSWAEDNHGEPWLWLDHVSVVEDVDPFAVGVVFPAHLFSIVRGLGMVWFKIEAIGATATRLDIELFLPPELIDDAEVISMMLSALKAINDEDTVINQRVGVGMSSRWAKPGPLSQLELGCQQLRSWIAEAVAAGAI